MKRNVYLILITVITILCIIAGTGYHLVRFGLSVAEGLPFFSEFIEAISDWDDDDDDSDDNDDSDNGISTSVDASQKNLDAFSSINADLNVVDLTIQRGNTFSITCKASKKLTPEYKVENNCLTITQYAKAHNALGRNKKCSVTITVADTLTDLKLHTNVGDVDLSGLNVLHLTCVPMSEILIWRTALWRLPHWMQMWAILIWKIVPLLPWKLPVMWEMSISIARKTCPVTI